MKRPPLSRRIRPWSSKSSSRGSRQPRPLGECLEAVALPQDHPRQEWILANASLKVIYVTTNGTRPVPTELLHDIVRRFHNLCPSRRRPWAPRLRPPRALPGTAITSRPCSSAAAAVIREPEPADASTTTTARARPLMIRLRSGKWNASGGVPGGCSVSTKPDSAMASASRACSGGNEGPAPRRPRHAHPTLVDSIFPASS